MTELQLIAAPILLRHRPTERYGMQFTPANWRSLDAWLAAELGRKHFKMTESHGVIETAQGDKDFHPSDWILKRRTRQGFEFYPVEDDVKADDYDEVGPAS